jgi:hypothetical protein
MSGPTASATPVYTRWARPDRRSSIRAASSSSRFAEYLVVYRHHRVGAEHGAGRVSGSDGVVAGTGQANDMRGWGLARQAGLVRSAGTTTG